MALQIKNKKILILIPILVIAFFLFFEATYIIEENEACIVTRLGEIQRVNTNAGIHLKVPFLDNVNTYSMRIMRIDGDTQKIPTKENQFIEVNSTSRWRIIDVSLFYKSLKNYTAAFSKITDIIDSSCRDIISLNSFDSIVRSSNIINEINAEEELNLDTNDIDMSNLLMTQQKTHVTITKGREEIAEDIKKRSNAQLASFGIELLDVIFKGIKYADELQDAVFSRMITERNQIASTIRSTGEGKKAEILGRLENEKQSILSESYAEAETIRGRADAEAAAIYSSAYNKDPAFYNFWKSLETYKKTLPNIEKIMSTDSEFFRFLDQAQ